MYLIFNRISGELYRRFVRFCYLFVVVIESFLFVYSWLLFGFVCCFCLSVVVIESFLFVYSWLLYGFVCFCCLFVVVIELFLFAYFWLLFGLFVCLVQWASLTG